MLTHEARRRLAVVLVGARNPQNIGAAARAMQDFGFADLRIVNEFGAPFEAAQLEAKSAVGAAAVMRAAQRFDSLPAAIADCTVVAGTTAIGGRTLHMPVMSLQAAAPEILSNLQLAFRVSAEEPPEAQGQPVEPEASAGTGHRVALLFGSEKTGLTNEQLSHCSLLLTIPLFAPEGRHLSMNLGQAVAVCLYELTREGLVGARELHSFDNPPASSADRERLTDLLLATMQQSGYAQRFPANARIEVVRRLAGSLGTGRAESATWMGLFRLILRRIAAQKPIAAQDPTSAIP